MDYAPYIHNLGQRARAASRLLAGTSDATKRTILHKLADALITATPDILAANALDLTAARDNALAQPLVERLKLDERKVAKMAAAVRDIAAQTDPVGQVIEGYVRPNGLRIERRRVPLGVVLFFYESRPNVTTDAAALCIKSGNAVILRGGKEALHSNLALAKVVQSAITAVDSRLGDAVQVIEITDRGPWQALMGPPGMPAEIVNAYAGAVEAMLRDPAIIERLARIGVVPSFRTPAQLAEDLREDNRQFGAIIRAAAITAE